MRTACLPANHQCFIKYHARIWICIFFNYLHTVSEVTLLDLHTWFQFCSLYKNPFFSVPPQIHAWERTLEVTAGDDLNIICEASGNPAPRVTWRKYETGREMLGDRVVLTNITRNLLKWISIVNWNQIIYLTAFTDLIK